MCRTEKLAQAEKLLTLHEFDDLGSAARDCRTALDAAVEQQERLSNRLPGFI